MKKKYLRYGREGLLEGTRLVSDTYVTDLGLIMSGGGVVTRPVAAALKRGEIYRLKAPRSLGEGESLSPQPTTPVLHPSPAVLVM